MLHVHGKITHVYDRKCEDGASKSRKIRYYRHKLTIFSIKIVCYEEIISAQESEAKVCIHLVQGIQTNKPSEEARPQTRKCFLSFSWLS